MASLTFTVGPLTATKTATDDNAARFVEGFLRSYCEQHDIDYDKLTNQQRMNLYIQILVNLTIEGSYAYWHSAAIRAAVEAVTTSPVVFA